MRPASSYRSHRKKLAKEIGVSLPAFNKAFDLIARQVEGEIPSPTAADAINPASGAAARESLAIWARNGGRVTAVSPAATADDLAAMNTPVPTTEQAVEAAKKITPEDVDKALEAALSNWQKERREGPLPLSRLFAARARTLGWVEGVEFVEE